MLPYNMDEAHEFHISKCIIEYAPSEKSFQIMMHLFLDDFELALSKRGGNDLKLCTAKEKTGADKFIFDYLQDNFGMIINGKLSTYNYIGKENSEDLVGVWIYLEIENVINFDKVEIQNSLLTELFDDQSNLVQIKVPGSGPGSIIMNKDKTKQSLNF